MELVHHALRSVLQAMHGAVRPVVWASGGKDSLCLLHLLQSLSGELTLLHVQLEDGWPGVTENLLEQAATWGYRDLVVMPPGLSYHTYVELYGYPATPNPCKLRRVSMPLSERTDRLGSNRVFVGTKAEDSPLAKAQGPYWKAEAIVGFDRVSPLYLWSDKAVYDYIDTHGIQLPEPYQHERPMAKDESFADCLSCTANPAHWKFLQTYYPKEFKERWPKVRGQANLVPLDLEAD